MSLPRSRTLAALGLERWRLRSRVAVGDPAPQRHAGPVADLAGTVPATAPSPARTLSGLQVHAPGANAPPADGVEAAVWRQVLAWLSVPATGIEFVPAPNPGVVDLPPPSRWSSAEGKRALWLALKAFAAPRA
ncbi:MAG: hypothetical protein KF823_14240 [Xanthomonadales bacterium]|nr:hypothetical protein [Xanthomonadales bacterium]